jgi:hypothetical protein
MEDILRHALYCIPEFKIIAGISFEVDRLRIDPEESHTRSTC